ncbi:MAG: hypothetical protein P4L50_00040 [Anaerolineaceae bacterium]|nr:hypothetical protein [Anaerolineaceae bacterium]
MAWFVLPGGSHFRHARVDWPIGVLGLIVLLRALGRAPLKRSWARAGTGLFDQSGIGCEAE